MQIAHAKASGPDARPTNVAGVSQDNRIFIVGGEYNDLI